MTSDDKKTKTNPTSKNEVPSKDKSGSGVDTSKAEGGKIADASPAGYCSDLLPLDVPVFG
jgi:hypothetical protein